jgi:hypothetical protein
MANSTSVTLAGPGDNYRIIAVKDHYAVERNGLIVGIIEHTEPSGWQFAPLGGNVFYGGTVAICMSEAVRYATSPPR